MKFFYVLVLCILGYQFSSYARCLDTEFCQCGRACLCEEELSKNQSVLSIASIQEMDQLIANGSRIIVKFYLGRCSACAFTAYFNQLIAEDTQETTFATFGVLPAEKDALLNYYQLPSLPVIVLYNNGLLSAIIKK